MARRLIGLDVGTNAVTIAEVTPGTPPRLDMFAQVALPRDAMREGEIADAAAVTDAVSRLRAEVGLKKASVRVGIASPRVIVRQVEMPVMTRDELASALKFQASDLIPISLDDAVLDFAILDENPQGNPEGGEPTMRVLLAAAQEATLMKLVSAVEAGGLQVAAVDLVPLALIRALARPVAAPVAVAEGGVALDEHVGAEGVVSFGGGVTAIAVHEGGIPRFVRVLGTGGRELTDAIAHDLEVPAETAEALKRAIGTPTNDETVARARTALDRPLSVLLDEVRSSIDYYRNQPGAARLQRVVVTGGSAQMPGMPERLSALVGVPIEPAYMHDLIRIGDIGFAPDELPRLEPYLPAAVGLALGGAGVGTAIDVLPRQRRGGSGAATKVRSRINPKIAAPVAAAVLLIAGATYMEHSKVADAQKKRDDAKTQVEKLKNQLGRLTAASTPSGQGGSLQAQAATLLGNDIGWTRMVRDVGAALPSGVWITSFQGQHTLTVKGAAAASGSSGAAATASNTASAASASANASAGGSSSSSSSSSTGGSAPVATPVSSGTCASYRGPIAGQVTIAGVAKDMPSLSAFLDALANAGDPKNPDVFGVWLTTAQKSQFGSVPVIQFTLNAFLSPGARSDRLTTYFKEPLCK
jgi:type IV pilus assembly protein PilM